MKITQRVLLLVIMNILSLLAMAGLLYFLSETEEEYFRLSNQILRFKNVLVQKQLSEELILRNAGKPEESEMKRFELKNEFLKIDRVLIEDTVLQFTLISDLLEKRDKLIGNVFNNYISDSQLSSSGLLEYENIRAIDDQLMLLADDLTGVIQNLMNIREDQEIFTIVGGLLLITLISIITNSAFGQSIVRPIEQLRAYVLSIDLSNIKKKTNHSVKNNIDSKKHLEISQLAETYGELENALFEKMSELEDRTENLSIELKERKKTEKKLKSTEKYLNNIIQSLNSIIITADSRFKLIHCNEMADKYAQNTQNDLFDRFPYLLPFETQIRNVIEKSRPHFENNISIEPVKDRFFNLTITPLAGDRTDGIVIIFDDITNLKSIEKQLIETQKWETIGVLTSGFAHDFNNVLTGIVTSSSILMHKSEQLNPQLDKSFINCLQIIDKSGKRAAAMIQQLLSLSRSNELNFTNVDLNESISDIKSICRNSFDKSIDIEVELLKERIPVLADSAQIEQTLLNLCINSYHAMTHMRGKDEEPRGTLKISMKEVYIDQYFRHEGQKYIPGNYIAVSISDTGVGITVEQKKKIFDPFFTTKDKTKGTGLGLTMVQHIINQHNGIMELYSEPGRGTVFTVYLPVSQNQDVETEKRDQKRELVKGTGAVLIIDDEEILRVLTESILEECGYKIFTAEDGFKGVDIYRDNAARIDLVILDMSMPGISGKETFIQLKQINPELKILMSSGFVKDDRIQDLINLGLEDFVQKPYDFIELSEKVASIINS